MRIFEKSGVGKKMESFFEGFRVGKKMKYFESFRCGKKIEIF
jgi:hypothetical protein